MPETVDAPIDRQEVFGERDGAIERIAPGFFEDQIEAEHVRRYEWARRAMREGVVIDAACGTGYGTALLSHGSARAVGVDIHAPAVAFARKNYSTVVIEARVEQLPLRTRSADSFVSFETIEHLDDPASLLTEVARVLRPGGLFLVSTPNANVSHGTNPYHVHELDLTELEKLLDRAGFELGEIAGQCWKLKWKWPRDLWGIRHFVWKSERNAKVRPKPLGRVEPVLWCIAAVRR